MAHIVVSDPLAAEGLQHLRDAGHEVTDVTALDASARQAAIAQAEAWIIRSGTTLDAKALGGAPRLRAVGRAGVGVDNVDLKAATAQGIAVFHAPTGNITSAAEQAWALMLAVARRVPEADAAMKSEDWARKRLKGTELAGKTLFIVGLGRIGRMMAARAQAFEMHTIGHDPFVTPEQAQAFGVTWMDLDAGCAEADIITLHTPLTPQTSDLIDAARLAHMRPSAFLINAARGGLVDAEALLAALDAGKLGGAGLDVWPEEPPTDWRLAKHPRVVAAPHLGASTTEAQTKAALQACERVAAFLASGDAGLAVNAQVSVPTAMRPWVELAEALAAFASQSIDDVEELCMCADPDLDLDALQVHGLVGALRATSDAPVNAINAVQAAKDRGWITATRTLPDDDPDYVRAEMRGRSGAIAIEGTYTPHYGPRVTRIDGMDLDFRPKGRFLFTRHDDVPGVLASITRVLAEAEVNVASVSLARQKKGRASAVIEVDGSIPRSAREALRALQHVHEAHRIRI